MSTVVFCETISDDDTVEELNCGLSEIFRQAMESFETRLHAGRQLEEQSLAQCLAILRDAGSPLEWEKTLPAKVAAAVDSLRQDVARSMQAINNNAQQAVWHMEKAVRLYRSNSSSGEEDGDFWTSALDALRANARMIHQANSRMLESWDQLAAEVIGRIDSVWADADRLIEAGMQPV